MLSAYIDDSLERGSVLIMAGFVASPARWEAFSDEWRKWVKHARLEAFHMSEIWARRPNNELWEHMPWFYGAVKDHIEGAITVAIPIEPLERVFKNSPLREYAVFGQPYFWGIRSILNWTGQYQTEWGAKDPIDFIFDERGEKKIVRDVWDFYKANVPPSVQAVTGREPIFEDDMKVLPLQAADMWAWWSRKQWVEKGTILTSENPIPWGAPGDFPTMQFEWGEADMREQFAKLLAYVDGLLALKGLS